MDLTLFIFNSEALNLLEQRRTSALISSSGEKKDLERTTLYTEFFLHWRLRNLSFPISFVCHSTHDGSNAEWLNFY